MRKAAIAGGAGMMMAFPAPTYSPNPPPVEIPQPSPQETAMENAVKSVDDILTLEMDIDPIRRMKLAETIVIESQTHGFDPLFVLAMIKVESGFNHEAVSPTGAKGLMQVIPGTWNLVVKKYRLGRMDKFDPIHNAMVGIRYLHFLGTSFKRLDTLVLAYNQGPGMASDILKKEAAMYGPRIMKVYAKFLKMSGLNPKDARKLFRSPEATLLRV
jgi:hypothetical protein